jgi:hypothetical protein
MALYEVTAESFSKIEPATFEQLALRERTDLQRLLKKTIEVILPDALVIAEEFGEWEESKRRIDLLALDRQGNLVVIELKRTEDGGRMDLQAIRYAAMVSTMTFDRAVDTFSRYQEQNGSEADARAKILHNLGKPEPDEESFAKDVTIVLVSANFSKEMTTAVMWLNKRDLDIRCIRLIPYQDNGRIFVDVQQVLPLPEAAEYQIQIREKEQKERKERAERIPLRKFWEELLFLAEGKTPLNAKLKPSDRTYIGTGAGISGVGFWYEVFQHSSRVQLYINRGEATINKKSFDDLQDHKTEIEATFGGALTWQRLDNRQACRIAYEMTTGGYRDDESIWPTIQVAMIEAMIRFEKALMPFVRELGER